MSPIERGITATALIATYGDQAFYKAMELYDEAIKKSDLDDMRRLRRAVMELQERGYSRHPLRDKEPAPAANAISAAEVKAAIDKLLRAAYEAGKRGEEWPS